MKKALYVFSFIAISTLITVLSLVVTADDSKAATRTIIFEAEKDSYTESLSPDDNHGTLGSALFGFDPTTDPDWVTRYFLWFDLGSATVDPGSTIVSAALNMYQSNSSGSLPVVVFAKPVNDTWEEDDITWNNQPGLAAGPGSSLLVGDTVGWVNWQVKDLVQGWWNGSVTNNGLVVMTDPVGPFHSFEYETNEGFNTPALSVTFEEPETGDSTPPAVLDLNVRVSDSQAIVTWSTDEDSTGFVDYGQSSSYGNTKGSNVMQRSHTVIVSGLKPGVKYEYRVRSTDSSGNEAVSSNRVFTTNVALEEEEDSKEEEKESEEEDFRVTKVKQEVEETVAFFETTVGKIVFWTIIAVLILVVLVVIASRKKISAYFARKRMAKSTRDLPKRNTHMGISDSMGRKPATKKGSSSKGSSKKAPKKK